MNIEYTQDIAIRDMLFMHEIHFLLLYSIKNLVFYLIQIPKLPLQSRERQTASVTKLYKNRMNGTLELSVHLYLNNKKNLDNYL